MMYLSIVRLHAEVWCDMIMPENTEVHVCDDMHHNAGRLIGASRIAVKSAADVQRHLEIARKKFTESADFARCRSQSHIVVLLTVERRGATSNPKNARLSGGRNHPCMVKLGTLMFVLCAAPSLENRGHDRGSTQPSLHHSLLNLEACFGAFSALRSGEVIPTMFRDSSLTRLVQASLFGSAFTTAVAVINPHGIEPASRVRSLLFAQRACDLPLSNLVTVSTLDYKALAAAAQHSCDKLSRANRQAASDLEKTSKKLRAVEKVANTASMEIARLQSKLSAAESQIGSLNEAVAELSDAMRSREAESTTPRSDSTFLTGGWIRGEQEKEPKTSSEVLHDMQRKWQAQAEATEAEFTMQLERTERHYDEAVTKHKRDAEKAVEEWHAVELQLRIEKERQLETLQVFSSPYFSCSEGG